MVELLVVEGVLVVYAGGVLVVYAGGVLVVYVEGVLVGVRLTLPRSCASRCRGPAPPDAAVIAPCGWQEGRAAAP